MNENSVIILHTSWFSALEPLEKTWGACVVTDDCHSVRLEGIYVTILSPSLVVLTRPELEPEIDGGMLG
jgi:hypothetical protein